MVGMSIDLFSCIISSEKYIAKVKNILSKPDLAMIIHNFIYSCLDYWNSPFNESSNQLINFINPALITRIEDTFEQLKSHHSCLFWFLVVFHLLKFPFDILKLHLFSEFFNFISIFLGILFWFLYFYFYLFF